MASNLTVNDWYEEGKKLEHELKDVEAKKAFRIAAEQGFAPAQYELYKLMHYNNKSESLEWLQKASEQGFAPAQYELSRNYKNVKENQKAFELILKLAEEGYKDAQNELSRNYVNDLSRSYRGVKFDKNLMEKVFNCIEKAAEQGLASAQYALSERYKNGDGVEKNAQKALEWLQKAAEHDAHNSQIAYYQYELSQRYKNGDGVEKNAQKASEWLQKAAEKGDLCSLIELLELYIEGIDGKKDIEKAFKLLQTPYARFHYGVLDKFLLQVGLEFAKEIGNEKSERRTFEIFQCFANKSIRPYYTETDKVNYCKAVYELAKCYIYGRGVTIDEKKAVECLEKASRFNKEANNDLNIIKSYLNRKNNIKEAVEWLKYHKQLKDQKDPENKYIERLLEAAEQGLVSAQVNLAYEYLNGKTVKKDDKKAAEWFKRAGVEEIEIYYTIANSYFRDRKKECLLEYWEKGKEFYNKAVELEAQNLEIPDRASLYWRTGNKYSKEYRDYELFITDYKEAEKWYTKAAELGDLSQQYSLAEKYAKGDYNLMPDIYGVYGIEKDEKKAFELFYKIATQNSDKNDYSYERNTIIAEAIYEIALSYANGRGVEGDEQKAIEWFEKAMNVPCSKVGYYSLAYMYYEGKEVPQNFKIAADYFTKCLAFCPEWQTEEIAELKFVLGSLFYNGLGVPQDIERGIRLLEESASRGCEDAIRELLKICSKDGSPNKDRESYYRELSKKNRNNSSYSYSNDYEPRILRNGYQGPDGIYYDDDGNSIDEEYAYGED